MSDSSNRIDGRKGRQRRSLVERAAERIAALDVAEGPRDAAPSHEEPSPPPAINPAALDLGPLDGPDDGEAPLGVGGGLAVDEALEAGAMKANGAADRSRAAPRPAQAPRGAKNQKFATIDFDDLQSRGFLTPNTKRNKLVEEFRLIKRVILSRRWDRGDLPGNTILVTSSLPSEGKTNTAINLAMSMAAEQDLTVLLVDADFIKPDALRQLGIFAKKGLIDVVENPNLDISDVMMRTNIDNLTVIPAGQLHDRCTELLASTRMREVVADLAHRYEDRIIIFDSPPVLVTTESTALASHMGQIVFVVQAERTKREAVMSALELLGEGPQIGLLLNRASAQIGASDFGSYYGSYYYGYGEGKER